MSTLGHLSAAYPAGKAGTNRNQPFWVLSAAYPAGKIGTGGVRDMLDLSAAYPAGKECVYSQ